MPVPKKPAKVMDAVHPTTAVASATSRPIITSRSVLKADPMLSPSDAAVGVFADEKPSGEPIPVSEGSSDSDSPLTQSVKAVAPGTVSSVVKSQVGENAENPESTPAEKS
ncbi:hypothetical protein JNM87_01570, partial [Candidatus Saccharibacteria bacterium]|nr:hypothetical protein [Candidatus Saccharibacteria bacterium]